jgi:thiazole synthase
MQVYGTELGSRLLLGTAQYPSPAILAAAVQAAGAEVVTVSLRRESGATRAGQGFWSLVRGLGVRVLPNTAGCHTVQEAVATAQMARELFGTPWIKLEVIGDPDTLQPDVFGLVEAARVLAGDPVGMARAFRLAVEAGREGWLADPIEPRDLAVPSTPVLGTAFQG